MATVKQDTDLGRLALHILWTKGFCGPNCDLSDLDVSVAKIEGGFVINFYDMQTSIGDKSRFYDGLNMAYSQQK